MATAAQQIRHQQSRPVTMNANIEKFSIRHGWHMFVQVVWSKLTTTAKARAIGARLICEE
jgi:hypothetical protein